MFYYIYIHIHIYIHTHTHTTSYSSVDGHLGCLHALPIVNSAAVNTGVLVSFIYLFIYLLVSFRIMVFSGYMSSNHNSFRSELCGRWLQVKTKCRLEFFFFFLLEDSIYNLKNSIARRVAVIMVVSRVSFKNESPVYSPRAPCLEGPMLGLFFFCLCL